jgi:predicted flap endonuclease-1-like 5' DNA nuclease
MTTALQIALLLLLIALIGIILGYLFGKLSCKKQASDTYIQKNDYCEEEQTSRNNLLSDLDDEKPAILSDKNVATANEEIYSLTGSSIQEDEEPLTVAKDHALVKTEDNADDGISDDYKPALLSEPRGGKADNLCRIKGIGFVIEEKLHNLGVFHFDQIAAWTENEIKWVDSHLAFSGRILREDWIGQAKKLAAGEETEFSQRVDKGEVATSRKTKENEK